MDIVHGYSNGDERDWHDEDRRKQHETRCAPNYGLTMGSKKGKLQPLKVGAAQVDDREIKLESPTSITMKNSFLIKNADPSFEKCYAQIRKRAIEKERTGLSPSGYDESLTKTSGKRPPARG